ncbi:MULTISPECIES: hypothetical protein, partial [unclassified Isoptericola]|uniref:hypothetical protein n=1 Tax=unclassified Isoptericola TaxID=2623355 RepID=UPI003654DDDE
MFPSAAVAAFAIALTTVTPTTETDPPLPPPEIHGFNSDESDTMGAAAVGNGLRHPTNGKHEADADAPRDKYIRADETTCFLIANTEYVHDVTHTPGACPANRRAIRQELDCPPDTFPLAPLWVQRVRNDGTYDKPEKIDDGQCITPADIAAAARREFRTMKIPTPKATLQGNPPMVVNVHYPAYTSAAPQESQVTLLTVPVIIRAEPTEFTWDFDDPHSADGTTLVTTDPGHPWHTGDPLPDTSWVGHTYTRLGTPGTDPGTHEDEHGNAYRTDVTVTLTTTWQGGFRVQGSSTWTDIPDTLTTTSTTTPTTVTEARTRLVCDDLDGHSTC